MPQLRQNEREQDVGMLLAGMAQTQIANHFNVLLWLRRLERWLEANAYLSRYSQFQIAELLQWYCGWPLQAGEEFRWEFEEILPPVVDPRDETPQSPIQSCRSLQPARTDNSVCEIGNTLLEEKGGGCCGTGSGEDIKPALIGWAREVLLWLRRLQRWLEANVFVEVFPVPGSRATTNVPRMTI